MMKKVLLASTALVAASMVIGGDVEAAEKIKINLGGYSRWYVVGAFQSSDYQNATSSGAPLSQTLSAGTNGAGQRANVDVKGDNEIWFSGSTALDNGLKVGVMVSLEAGGHVDILTDVIDQSYAWVEGNFGKVMLGTSNNSAALTHVSAPDLGGGLLAGGYLVAKPSSVIGPNALAGWTTSLQTTAIMTDDKAEKIIYLSPSLYGLSVNATYVPNTIRQDSRGTPLGRNEAFAGGALYANTIGPVGVKLSASAMWIDLTATGAGESSFFQHAYGANLSYAGFTLGGSFQRASQDHGNGKSPSFGTTLLSYSGDTRSGVATYSSKGAATSGGLDFGGYAYDAGLSYSSGPYSIGVNYFHSSTIGLVNSVSRNGRDDTIDAYSLSGKYNLGPGVDVMASTGYIDYRDQRKGSGGVSDAALENSGWAVTTGLQLSF